jgi:hypothetical protein
MQPRIKTWRPSTRKLTHLLCFSALALLPVPANAETATADIAVDLFFEVCFASDGDIEAARSLVEMMSLERAIDHPQVYQHHVPEIRISLFDDGFCTVILIGEEAQFLTISMERQLEDRFARNWKRTVGHPSGDDPPYFFYGYYDGSETHIAKNILLLEGEPPVASIVHRN